MSHPTHQTPLQEAMAALQEENPQATYLELQLMQQGAEKGMEVLRRRLNAQPQNIANFSPEADYEET